MRLLQPASKEPRHFCASLLSSFEIVAQGGKEDRQSLSDSAPVPFPKHAPAIFSTRLSHGARLNLQGKYLRVAVRAEGLAAKTAKEKFRVDTDGIRASRRREQRLEGGEGRLKGILILVVVVLGIYTAIKLVPAYVNDYQLSDKMQEQARFAVVNRFSEDQIRDNIFKVMQDLDIPAEREDIKVVANNSVVKISLDYTVPVDVLMYHADLHFSPNSENKALF